MGRAWARLLNGRVARRLMVLFVAAALVPLMLTAWITNTAVTELVERNAEIGMVQGTRQVGLQVFDRLLAAKAVLTTWPQDLPVPAEGLSLQNLPGGARLVRGVAHLGPDGAQRWSLGSDPELLRSWQAAQGDDTAAPLKPARPGEATARLRWLMPPARPGVPDTQAHEGMRLLLAVAWGDRVRWIVELDPGYVWSPVTDAAVGSGWRMQDADGPTLHLAGDEHLVPGPLPPGLRGLRDASQATVPLFLAAEFGARPWLISQHQTVLEAAWMGVPLSRWLALMAVLTLLAVTLVSLQQIRRILWPLESLTQATQRFGNGNAEERVHIGTDDEFGALGEAFNDMAGRLDQQMRSLAGLAALDRDILNGASIEFVVDHVVDQLAQRHPDAAVAVAWLVALDEGAAAPKAALRVTSREGPEGERVRRPARVLDAPGHAAFLTLQSDLVLPRREVGRRPWCAAVRAERVTHIALLPIAGLQGHADAVVVLGLREAAGPDALRPAADLRDRLTVAMAARHREQALEHRARHDGLTGLLNRNGMQDALKAFQEQHPDHRCALLLVDLDHFKYVNDSLGHEAGDHVLREVGRRLRKAVPDNVMLARLGGDEFVVVAPNTDAGGARALAALLVRQLTRPVSVQGADHVLGASIGIALSPDHGQDMEDLLRRADMAMYAAKSAGRAQWALFDPKLDKVARERIKRLGELRRAVERNEFVGYFQPRVSTRDGRVGSAETLVRWMHPERGLLGPGEFIGLAEECDLIEGIGVAMLRAACAQMAQWRRLGASIHCVSVNVSARQLGSGRLTAQVRTALAEHGIPAHALELEVTESLLAADARGAWEQLAGLRKLGVRIALDDFGTGYSSMATLRELPIDVMKVDRAFVKDLGRDPSALAITRAIVSLARTLNLHLVAEGVETEAQAKLLRELGCDELQGFLYSKPVDGPTLNRLPGVMPAAAGGARVPAR